MTVQEQKKHLILDIMGHIQSLKISAKFMPYVQQFIKDCNVHQLQNLMSNMSEFKKFIIQSK